MTFPLGKRKTNQLLLLAAVIVNLFAGHHLCILLNKESTVDLRPRLLHTVAPWGGSTPPPGLHEKCFSWQEQQRYILCFTHSCGFGHVTSSYIQRGSEAVPNTIFIDNKMMHLQYSAFGGKARWRWTLSITGSDTGGCAAKETKELWRNPKMQFYQWGEKS